MATIDVNDVLLRWIYFSGQLWLPFAMDSILDTIDSALERKGLTDAEASRLAVGNASLIKNMRLKRSGEKRYNLLALKRLADILDLELYFGEPRMPGQSQVQMQFSEVAPSGEFLSRDQSDAYWRLPWNRFCRLDAAAYFMFHKRWLRRALGREPDNLSTVDLPDGSGIAGVGGPVTAMIDEHAERMGTSYWVWRENDGPRAGRLTWGKTTIVIEGRDGVVETRILEGAERQSIQPLGRILWVGLVLTGNAPFRESKNDE